MHQPSQKSPLLFTPAIWAIVSFTSLYMGAALIAAIRFENTEFKLYLAVMTILLVTVLIIHSYVRLTTLTIALLSLWGVMHMAGGLLRVPDSWTVTAPTRVLYNWWIIPGWLKFDQVVHFGGYGLVTWITWQALRAAFARRGLVIQPAFGLLTLCVAAASGFGAFNEVIEFLATRVLPRTNVGGYTNTGWDLVANLLGSILTATLIYFSHPKPADQ